MHSHILTPARALLLRNVCILSGIFFGIQNGSCYIKLSNYYTHDNTRLTANYDQIRTVTDIACCCKCHSDSSCNSVSYNPGTKECQLSNINMTETGSATEDNGEWTTFSETFSETLSETKPSCKNYLVSGSNGVKDSQLTESNYWCKHRSCPLSDGNSAKYARLNMTGTYTGEWMTDSSDSDEYVQVDFLNVRTISTIALQGGSYSGFVVRFKVLTSKDCVSFTAITDDTGNDKLFIGNNQRNKIVIRDLPVYVRARCVRINPVQWHKYQALRFDVLGC